MKLFRVTLAAALLAAAPLAPGFIARSIAADPVQTTCPVTQEKFVDGPKQPGVLVDSKKVAFCCNKCPAVFAANPEKYLTADRLGNCPVMGGPNHINAKVRVALNNELQYFCCGGCDTKFSENPSAYRKSLTDVVTHKPFATSAASPKSTYKNQIYLFSSDATKATFDKTPDKYAVVFGPKPEEAH